MNDLARGAIGGLAGTVAMSAAMAASRMAGAMRRQVPPRVITANVAEAAGVRDQLSQPAFEASWVVNHLAYGAAAGIAFEATSRAMGRPHPILAGPAFGVALWAFGYAGWLPALGLYPPPAEDTRDRISWMIAHHLIYGTATALATEALRDGPPRPDAGKGRAGGPDQG